MPIRLLKKYFYFHNNGFCNTLFQLISKYRRKTFLIWLGLALVMWFCYRVIVQVRKNQKIKCGSKSVWIIDGTTFRITLPYTRSRGVFRNLSRGGAQRPEGGWAPIAPPEYASDSVNFLEITAVRTESFIEANPLWSKVK